MEWGKGSRAYIGEKSRKMSKRRKNLERRQNRAIEEKSGLLHNIETAEDLKLFPQKHYKDVLVRMEDLQISYVNETGGSKRLPVMNFEISNGDRVVLQGANGCGKSSVIKALLAAVAEEDAEEILFTKTGTVTTAGGLIISYVSQDTGHLHGTLAEYAEREGIDLSIFLALLRKLDFSRVQFEKPIEDYSGGQKKKVLLAGSLCKQAHLYIWDEPLNFIDVFSRMQLENLILQFQPTMLLVEHDKTFVENVATKVVKFG